MSKKKLFDEDSDEEVALKTENEYAKKYDNWREKEEIHKLEQKYGSKALDPNATLSSDSEDESDEPPEVSEEMETQFLKTLALLKTKDPRIYDPSFKFFEEKEEKTQGKNLENKEKKKTLTFDDSDDDDDDPNIFTIEKKAEVDKEDVVKKTSENTTKEGKLKDFLTGKAEHIEDEVEKDLEPLKAFWSNPQLNEGEAFLRDYILNKRYMEEGGEGEAADKLRDDEDLEADEALVEEQGKFERAYNFRFEEPDDEYLKRYPRTLNSIRPKDDRRARKRAETRTRKEEEKKKKMEEIARLKALKLKEVREKIERIKQVTGNQELAFKDEDIEGDFDPEEHDRRMKAIFDETYYGEADDEKPVFPDLDEELEIENWEKYDAEELRQENGAGQDDAPHCEDEDFNMDADYEPKAARENLLEELRGKKRRSRKRKSKLAQLLETERPTFVPQQERTYAEFMEEYYKLDCEDVVGGDLPTRFKYRQTVPNAYGLTVEEILLADDKELTQWVPLKKIVKYRPENVEKSEVNTYRQKAADVELKKKMLPSLFKDLPQEPEVVVPVKESNKKKKKKKKDKMNSESNTTVEESEVPIANEHEDIAIVDATLTLAEKKKKKKRKVGDDVVVNGEDKITGQKEKDEEETDTHENVNIDEGKHLIQENDIRIRNDSETSTNSRENKTNPNKVVGKKKKRTSESSFVVETVGNVGPSQPGHAKATKSPQKDKKRTNSDSKVSDQGKTVIPSKKKKKDKQGPVPNKNINGNKMNSKMKFKAKEKFDRPTHPFSNLSDERLIAYGLNPKKYKNFLKYKKF